MPCGCSQNSTRSIIRSINMGGRYMNPIGRNVSMKRNYRRQNIRGQNMRTKRIHLLSSMNITRSYR